MLTTPSPQRPRNAPRIKIYFGIAVAVTLLLSPNLRAQKAEENEAAAARAFKAQRHLTVMIKKANTGNAQAQFALARAYEEGSNGVQKNLAYAMSWYEESARNGFASARDKIKKLRQPASKKSKS